MPDAVQAQAVGHRSELTTAVVPLSLLPAFSPENQ